MNHNHFKQNLEILQFRFLFILIFFSVTSVFAVEKKIDLRGAWTVKFDSGDIGISKKWYSNTFTDQIHLPGTTDDAQMGIPYILKPELKRPQVSHLTRKNSYVGVVWYSKIVNVPNDWKDKQITLKLERVIWQTNVWVDERYVEGKQESLTTPHYVDLSNYLTAGKHKITIRVDNRRKYDISVQDMAHSYTNETQIMWNGIIGEISCIAQDKINIDQIQVYPDVEKKLIRVKISVSNFTNLQTKGNMNIFVSFTKLNKKLNSQSQVFQISKGISTFEMKYPMGENFLLWDEFNPNLYTLTAEIKGKDFQSTKTEIFGMRNLTNEKAKIQVNGRPVFLRGTLECCIFPQKGYPPMDKKGWKKEFETARNWGLNHLRFHSWCPPEAAFQVADEMGFYLQIELPLWSLTVNKDKSTDEFLYAEAERIIKEYGNHPSFCFWSLGNELQPDFNFLNAFVDKLKAEDSRHLYTNTTYSFEKGHGDWPERNDDYFVTQKTKIGWVRGQGVFDTESPSFNKDYSASLDSMTVPLITHEIGQYAVYPNINEIQKYTGVLDPLNFKAVKADLIKKDLIDKANNYLMASGKLAVLLYKEEIERAMKTKGISGFQLLGLQDFPGQGTALVGLLDAFWDSKGLISAEDFRQFCSPVVPLIRYEKATYINSETFKADVEIVNYGNTILTDKKIIWQIVDNKGAVIGNGNFKMSDIPVGGRMVVGSILKNLSEISDASCLKVKVEVEGTPYKNNWQIWVYPSQININKADIIVTANREEAWKALNEGEKVLFSPRIEDINGLEGKFVQVFWSPVHFPDQAGTMGLLVNPNHPALKNFPTEMHTNWQWWNLCKNSKTICIDSISGANPIVENVDNFMNNRRLCSIFEAKVGNGNLIFSSMDLLADTSNRPVAKQLLYSLIEYMKSGSFAPKGDICIKDIENFILKNKM